MKKINIYDALSLLTIFLISLIPLLWYQPGTIAMGHDMGWSLDPIQRFLDRLYTWSLTGFGSDHSLYVGTITFYGIEAFFAALGFSAVLVQKCTFIFWFFAMASSMYYLCRVIYKGKYSYLLALIASVFYVVNHFTLHDWIIAEFSKFSAMTLFPLVIAFLWQVIDKKMKLITGIFLIAIFSLIFNGGGGSGIPVMGGLLLSVFFLFFYKVIVEHHSFFRLLKIYLLVGMFALIVNMYWIAPLIHVQGAQYSPFAQAGGAEVTVNWTNVISKNASIFNLLRLQGFSSWYDEPSHPYASVFLNNPLLIIISILFPIFAFAAAYFARNKEDRRTVTFFILLLLLSLLFTAGTHPPFGYFYQFLMEKVYGFAIFRTAFYKFGYVVWFCYAFLIAYSVIFLLEKLRNRFVIILGGYFFIFLILAYSYPFFTGSFFEFKKPFTIMIKLPSYILESQKYMIALPKNSRTFLLPPPSPTNGQSDVYEFGYFSRTPLPFQLTQKSIITNLEINTDEEEKLTESLYNAILNGDSKKAQELTQELGLTHFLLRQDVMTNNPEYRVSDPLLYKEQIQSFNWLKKNKVFGQWEIYSVDLPTDQFRILQPNIRLVTFKGSDTSDLLGTRPNEIVLKNIQMPFSATPSYSIIAHCETCNNSEKEKVPDPQEARVLPTSPLYLLTKAKETKTLNQLKNEDYLYLRFLLVYSKKRALEIATLAGLEQYSYNSEHYDEQQRSQIFSEYNKLLTQILPRFKKLSYMQKLRISSEIIRIIEDEKKTQLPISKNPLIDFIYEEYVAVRSSLDEILKDQEIFDLADYQKKNFTYTFSIPEEGIYEMMSNIATGSAIVIDDQKVNLSTNKISLSKGDHILRTVRQENNILKTQDITLNKENPEKKYSLNFLKPDTSYTLSFSFSTTQNSGLRVEVIDDFNNKKITESINPNTLIKKITLNFRTPSAIKKPYELNLFLEDKETIGDTKIYDMKLVNDSYPEIVFSNYKDEDQNWSSPSLATQFINPTHYKIHIQNATSPFILIFGQTYEPGWIATSENRVFSAHIPINSSFNGWYIDKTGNYDIDLQFNVQKNYFIGIIISLVGVIAIGILFIISSFKKL